MPASSSLSRSSLRIPQERGSLRTLKEGKSEFIGSSSGVYFVNTVRRAFSAANSRSVSVPQDATHPSPEDCLLPGDGDDDNGSVCRSSRAGATAAASQGASKLSYGPSIPLELGRPPPANLAKQLFMSYFQTWHQFLPFLHGPALLQDIELLYADIDKRPLPNPRPHPLPLAKVITLQCLFNLANLHCDDLPMASRIDHPVDILSLLPDLAIKSDIISTQALLAAQLLLVARLALRPAAVVGGLLSRSIFLAGLHRCPNRYLELSTEECNIRKRVFWSVYVIDRYISQALGQPLGIQDSDIDVCSLSGPELHDSHCHTSTHSSLHTSHLDSTWHASRGENSPSDTPSVRQNQGTSPSLEDGRCKTMKTGRPQSSSNSECQSQEHHRHSILASYVDHSRLLGNALELFHKSLHVRSIKPEFIISLRTDVSAWWNALPIHLQNDSSSSEAPATSKSGAPGSHNCKFGVAAFFSLLHNQLVLLINRPWLSLEPSSSEFQSALQTCIGASREIITILDKQLDSGNPLFWPGYLSAAWMAGIILAFACHLSLYPVQKGQKEISACLGLLSVMSRQWSLAKNCHTVLSDLQESLGTKKSTAEEFPIGNSTATMRTSLAGPPIGDATNDARPTAKRRRLDGTSLRDFSSSVEAPEDPANCPKENLVSHTQITTQPSTTLQPTAVWSSCDMNPNVTSDARLSAGFNRGDSLQENVDWHFNQASDDGTTMDAMYGLSNLGGMRLMPMNNLDGHDTGWMTEFGSMDNWDNGMPDVFAGATWESLLHVISQDNLTRGHHGA